jgi:hypothetical protein
LAIEWRTADVALFSCRRETAGLNHHQEHAELVKTGEAELLHFRFLERYVQIFATFQLSEEGLPIAMSPSATR